MIQDEALVNTLPSPNRLLFRIVLGMYFSYMTVGLALPAIALYVKNILGFNNIYVGVAIGAQFVATLLTRNYAGMRADQFGARHTTRFGMICCGLSGLLYIASSHLQEQATIAFSLLILGRIILGFGESLILTGNLSWGMGLVGAENSGKVMSWNGMATYGALATSAPLGLWLYHLYGFQLAGTVTILLPMVASMLILGVPRVPVIAGKRAPFLTVIKKVWQPGLALGLQGTGFAVISSFVVLYFTSEGWLSSGFALSAFGLAFVLTRLLCGSLPDKIGGTNAACISFVVEAVGLLILGFAPSSFYGLLGAAVAGIGCSLIFPSLGTIVVRRVEPQSRGSALGAYSAFQDIAYGFTGPLTGIIANSYGYRPIFILCSCCAAMGLIITYLLKKAG